jgi:hypothetical protein
VESVLIDSRPAPSFFRLLPVGMHLMAFFAADAVVWKSGDHKICQADLAL